MRLALVALVFAVVAGCAAPERPPGTTDAPKPTSPPPSPTASVQPSPRSSLEPASDQPAPDGVPLVGILGADAVEGGCAYLQADDGTRYEVIYPDGWRVQTSPLQLLDPDGAVVANGGDDVAVRGSIANDMASICQIGPIFRATDVDVDG